MILDKEAELVTAVPFDTKLVEPGPGEPLVLLAHGVKASLVITTGDTSAAADALMTLELDASGTPVSFTLPSSTKRYIKTTFAQGTVSVILDGHQTNV